MSRKEGKRKSGFGKFALGVGVGAALGVLFAPQAGSETRKELAEKMKELYNKAKEIDLKEVRENIALKIEELKLELKELDKEKVAAIAKEKAAQIKDKAGELVELAKEKGTPALEKAADAVRDKAIDVVRETLERLEASKEKAKLKKAAKQQLFSLLCVILTLYLTKKDYLVVKILVIREFVVGENKPRYFNELRSLELIGDALQSKRSN